MLPNAQTFEVQDGTENQGANRCKACQLMKATPLRVYTESIIIAIELGWNVS